MPPTSQLIPRILKASSVLTIALGSFNACLGVNVLSGFGPVPPPSPQTSVNDSQIRFLGTMLAGWGVMLWWASGDVVGRRTPIALLGSVMTVGGVGRLVSGLKLGFPSVWARNAMLVEMVGPSVVYLVGRSTGHFL